MRESQKQNQPCKISAGNVRPPQEPIICGDGKIIETTRPNPPNPMRYVRGFGNNNLAIEAAVWAGDA